MHRGLCNGRDVANAEGGALSNKISLLLQDLHAAIEGVRAVFTHLGFDSFFVLFRR